MVLQNKFIKFIITAFLLFFVTSIANGEKYKFHEGRPLHLRYATHFKVEYLKDGCKRVTDGADKNLLLVPWGQRRNVFSPESMIIRIPVKRVVTRWSTPPSFLKALGVIHTIVGVTTRKNEWCAEQIKKWMAQGTVEDMGGHRAIDYEKFSAIKPDIFFASKWEKINKLKELEIPCAVITEYSENHPLGRLEWLMFFAAFYNKEKEAKEYLDEAFRHVSQLSEKIEKIKKRPRVLWGVIRRGGMIYAPRGNCYVNNMIAIAGGDSVLKGLSKMGNAPISLEHFYKYGSDADIYICPDLLPSYGISSIRSLVTLNPILSGFRSVKKGNIWCFQPWYWESIDKADEIIEDLAAIFHPNLFPGHSLRYFFKIPLK